MPSPTKSEYELDVSGHLCPFPVLKAASRLRQLEKGDRLRVIATDAGAWDDFVHFCESHDYRLLRREKSGESLIFLLEK